MYWRSHTVSTLQNRSKALKVLCARIFELQRRSATRERSQQRRQQIGSGERHERIRTYHFVRVRLNLHSTNFQCIAGNCLAAFFVSGVLGATVQWNMGSPLTSIQHIEVWFSSEVIHCYKGHAPSPGPGDRPPTRSHGAWRARVSGGRGTAGGCGQRAASGRGGQCSHDSLQRQCWTDLGCLLSLSSFVLCKFVYSSAHCVAVTLYQVIL